MATTVSPPSVVAATPRGSETLVVSLSTAQQLFTCFDAKNRSDSSMLRQSEFHCSEHNAEALEHLLIPAIMCCNDQQCVPSFAEAQQSFLIDSIECNTNKDRCRIVLRCQPAFDELLRLACGTALSIIVVIVSSFWLNSRRQQHASRRYSFVNSALAFYERVDKTN